MTTTVPQHRLPHSAYRRDYRHASQRTASRRSPSPVHRSGVERQPPASGWGSASALPPQRTLRPLHAPVRSQFSWLESTDSWRERRDKILDDSLRQEMELLNSTRREAARHSPERWAYAPDRRTPLPARPHTAPERRHDHSWRTYTAPAAAPRLPAHAAPPRAAPGGTTIHVWEHGSR